MILRCLILLLSLNLQPLWADPQSVDVPDPGFAPELVSNQINGSIGEKIANMRKVLDAGRAKIEVIESNNENLKKMMKRLEQRVLELRARMAEKDRVIDEIQQDTVSTGM